MKKTALFVLTALCAVAAFARSPAAFRNGEKGRGYASLQKAVDGIGSGEGTIIIAPGTYRQCAIQKAGVIAFRAAVPGQTIFDGATCEGKAALVLRGRAARNDGVVFQNMRVPDANGPGIRLEKGDLTVTRAIFRNSQQGILTADDKAGEIRITQSTFSGLGRCDRGNGGHYIKSSARQVSITDNAFDDTRGRKTQYIIDLPNGATGKIVRNMFVQGASKENDSAFITVAAEGWTQSSAGLAINANEASIAHGVNRQTIFLADWSGDRLALGGNRLGRGLKPFQRR